MSLQQACGYQYTNKLHRMFTDMTVSSGIQTEFTASLKKEQEEQQKQDSSNNNFDLGLNFTILTLTVRVS